MSSSNCYFLTCIQVSQEAGQVVWYSHLFQNFPQFIVIHTVKGFGIVNKTEIDVFLELSWFFDDPADVGNLISGRVHHAKCQAGRITSWNQDCQEKYQELQICTWYHSDGESEEELNSLLMRVKEESERASLRINIKKTLITVSALITSWQTEGEKVEVVTDFLFLGSRITADSDCSHEIKRWLLLGRKAMTNLDSVLKSRDITLLTKVHIVKAIVFPAVTFGCESWTIKKAECQRIDAFELWHWRRLLKVPWTARRSASQS